MSNQMQLARLRVPVECLTDDPIAVAQLASAAAWAADEIERLTEDVHLARDYEARYWKQQVENLSAQLRYSNDRYMELLKYAADFVALQPRTVVLTLPPDAEQPALSKGERHG